MRTTTTRLAQDIKGGDTVRIGNHWREVFDTRIIGASVELRLIGGNYSVQSTYVPADAKIETI
ncbi:MAG TPA: hypothetical protein VFR23_19465 [Jiangellaceae bacterium]|nr:hypothetical protein [Jiangellaceae bacterium]